MAAAQGFGFGGLCRFLSHAGPSPDPTVASGVQINVCACIKITHQWCFRRSRLAWLWPAMASSAMVSKKAATSASNLISAVSQMGFFVQKRQFLLLKALVFGPWGKSFHLTV
jgi:hypothetical protein